MKASRVKPLGAPASLPAFVCRWLKKLSKDPDSTGVALLLTSHPMHLAGIVLTVIGGIILFAGSMGWRFHRASREAEAGSTLDDIDLVFGGGLFATLSGIFRLLGEVANDRSSPLFSFAILVIVGLIMVVTGGVFLWLGNP